MTKIILDCDPGHDDALAMMLAVASPKIELMAVTTSAGNQTPDKTLNNALRMLTLLKHNEIPVAAGNQSPLIGNLHTAGNVHGSTGLDGAKLPVPSFKPLKIPAINLMANIIYKTKEKITLVVTGPMTNVALFLRVYPQLAKRIKRIVFMGGAMGTGNWRPSVEFNIFVDAEAAKIVINSGIPLVMAGLNVTHKALIRKEEIKSLNNINNSIAHAFHDLLNFFDIYYSDPKWGFNGAPLHDPCTVSWLIDPSLFQSKIMNVDVETKGELTQGETVCDFYNLTGKRKNAKVLLDIDRDRFIQLIIDSLKSFS